METVQVMIRKRKNSKGQPCYQVIIRDNDGHPPKYETYPTELGAKEALPRYVVLQHNLEGTPAWYIYVRVPSFFGSLFIQ